MEAARVCSVMSCLYQHIPYCCGQYCSLNVYVRNKTSRSRRARCGVLMAIMGASVVSVVASSLLVDNDDSWSETSVTTVFFFFFCNSVLDTAESAATSVAVETH